MNRDRGAGPDRIQAVISRDRPAAGPVADPVQTPVSRDRAILQVPNCENGLQTLVGPDGGDMLDSAGTGDKRVFAGSVSGGRESQAGENHSEPPPTNPILIPPQQVGSEPAGSAAQDGPHDTRT